MKKIVFGALMVLTISVGLAGCGSSSDKKASSDDTTVLDAVKKDGKLTVATSADFPPFEFQILKDGQNQIVGSDIDLAQKIADKLGLTLEIQNSDFNTVLTSLQAGKSDIAISGISAQPERKKTFDFSTTYYQSVNKVVVKKSELANYQKISDLKGENVGAQKGSIQEGVVTDQIKDANLISIAKIPALINELKNDKIAGLVLEEPIAKAYVANNPDLVIADIELKSSEDDAYAIALPKNSGKLKTEVDSVIKELKESGEIDQLIQKNFELSQSQND
ncbi:MULTISPECIES: transporter substrate-binding domain-containing protein [unclassified Enterococcus]|uniref:transporter substrate-binding domain-containing protein n=1 Tax=unclassified Enterococcus TaxID=2608891 RepID=UPI00155736E0|nr:MULTISPECIES: transporter substrate-binding domain-containing protein [unclassified Enterococcus]MBS7577301.1 transporter substrate-binding domain-containing protein [Enterococcus sp. MMGLQ5-2]MBS7584606.1 transporter substrate-binding domain-containing protein [Enterococcus sp. MMGLQ5-1]NPD12461.1 transporter substrate-binding domain-containing protein [Enterococcus sp. MMGLQ5-1]NPD37135.1 transporter substrate-binding domain-containing protein [Enterococcus sp. MMGLQ5-2]